MSSHDQPDEGKMVLGHDAVKGYRPAFLIAITIGTLYLGYILYKTL
jgi:hypothetical protein